MIFADHALALRHERAAMAIEADYARGHARLHPDQDIEVRRFADGAAVFAGVGSPMSQATGLGLEGPVTSEDLEALEEFYHRRCASARVVVCPLADPSLVSEMASRGFALTEFEQVMVRDLQNPAGGSPSPSIVVSLARPDELDEYIDAVGPSFTPDGVVSPEMRTMMSGIFLMKDARVFLARIEGQAVGGGSLLIHQGLAMLAGAATKPEHRGKGVHEALFLARIALARDLGCHLAVMGAAPGSGSQRNSERKGFQVAYTKAVLTKAPR